MNLNFILKLTFHIKLLKFNLKFMNNFTVQIKNKNINLRHQNMLWKWFWSFQYTHDNLIECFVKHISNWGPGFSALPSSSHIVSVDNFYLSSRFSQIKHEQEKYFSNMFYWTNNSSAKIIATKHTPRWRKRDAKNIELRRTFHVDDLKQAEDVIHKTMNGTETG